MRPFTDPPIPVKIAKMKQRVCWQHPWLQAQGIDQTRLVLDYPRQDSGSPGASPSASPGAADRTDQPSQSQGFSFLVIGDTGWGPREDCYPQRHIAEVMLPHLPEVDFILHTGDVVYTLGSKEYYPSNFIQPYREWLVGGEQPERIAYDQMRFRVPFFPSLGNHDYCHMPTLAGIAVQGVYALGRFLGLRVRKNIGWQGSGQGDVYARAFMDYLQSHPTLEALQAHVQQHYTAETDTGRCLRYRPGEFTRIPNRYYSFSRGGIEFFALDSTTLNQWDPEAVDALPDREQRQWLRDRLIQSWQNSQVRGRILFFHHPPYVTEATKWKRTEAYAMRHSLRWVLDGVVAAVPDRGDRPVVDGVFSGHAHCLEYLQTGDTGHGDAHLSWWVCGGSGCSTRRQRQEGAGLPEWPDTEGTGGGPRSPDAPNPEVARSRLYVGKAGQGADRRERYSFLRVDVEPGSPLRWRVRPFASHWHQGRWWDEELDPVVMDSVDVNSGILGP